MDNREQPGSPKIAYLIKCFPRLSETFILHEVLELERQGLPLHIFSLLRPTGKVNKAVQDVQASVTYMPTGFPLGKMILLAGIIRRFLKAPVRVQRVIIAALLRYHHSSTPRNLLYAAYLAEQFERQGITHIHAHYANTPTTVAQLVSDFTGIPYSFTAHAKDIYLSPPKTLAYKMRRARFVVTCTDYNQRHLAALVTQTPEVSIRRIYHGLNLRVFPANAVPASPEPPLILTVARLVEKKGLPDLLQACRILKDQGYDFTYRLVGEGPLRPALEQQIHELALDDRVELCGSKTHEQVIEMYQHATLLALPCVVSENGDRDGIPNVLVESLYMKVPVVSTPVSGIPELITSEQNGLLVPPHESEALAAAIARLLDDPELRRQLAIAGRKTVVESFDMTRNTTRLMNMFQQQLGVPCSSTSDTGTVVSLPSQELGEVQVGAR